MIFRLFIILSLLFFSSTVYANILDIKLSPAQVFDVQWNIQGTTFNASNFTRPFYSRRRDGTSCGFCQMTQQEINDIVNNGQYFGFFESSTNPGTYGFAVFNNNGTIEWVLHETGTFRALSPDVVFYLGDGFWGTVISVTQGFNYGESNTWFDIINNPTQQDIDNYQPGSTAPLQPGESASSSSPPPPEPVFSSSITFAQTIRRGQALSSASGNNAQVFIQGNSNDVTVQQAGPGHYSLVDIVGSSNLVLVDQQSITDRHYSETLIGGNNNTITVVQQSSSKNSFVVLLGDDNNVSVTQVGLGNHYLDLKLEGNDHDALIVQEGSGSHNATVELSGSQPWTFILNQSGSANQVYSLPHMMTDGSIVSGHCASVGGCSLLVTQNE